MRPHYNSDMLMTRVVKKLLLEKFCIYGSLNKSGWVTASIRRTNGMVALTPTLDEKNMLINLKVPFYISKNKFKQKKIYDTTFTFSLVTGFKPSFG